MKNPPRPGIIRTSIVLLGLLGFVASAVAKDTVDYAQPVRPYSNSPVFETAYSPVTAGQKVLPVLTWAPDGHLVSANGGLRPNANSALAKALGEPIEIQVMDRVDDQVKAVIEGQPFFRGTLAQVALVNEGLKKVNPNLELVVIYQISWSTGADGFVTVGVKTLADLKGKAIVGQLNGPHMLDMVPKILEDAGLQPGDVELRYVSEITTTATEHVVVARDPANALRNDKTLAGAAMIGPDIAAVTSGEGVGAVKNSKVPFTTRTAPHLIADVIAVRKDYFEKNEAKLKQFVKVLLDEANSFAAELDNVALKKGADAARLNSFKKKCEPLAKIFLGDSTLANDFIVWIGVDAELAKVRGNVEFFQSTKNPVGFDATIKTTQKYLVAIGFTKELTPLGHAAWDWSNLGASAFVSQTSKAPAFANIDAVRAAASKSDSTELMKKNFQFAASESDLSWRNYEPVFDELHEKVKRYGGAVIQIRGHADPFLYNFFKMKLAKGEKTYDKGAQKGIPIPPLESVINSANKLSYTRASSVKTAYAAYLREKIGVGQDEIDLSRFDIRGMGLGEPIYPNPVTKEQIAANMRGELVIISVETELTTDFNLDDLK
jgi:outer membrane protein OmpA-like peptidoglycan-associated protein